MIVKVPELTVISPSKNQSKPSAGIDSVALCVSSPPILQNSLLPMPPLRNSTVRSPTAGQVAPAPDPLSEPRLSEEQPNCIESTALAITKKRLFIFILYLMIRSQFTSIKPYRLANAKTPAEYYMIREIHLASQMSPSTNFVFQHHASSCTYALLR